MAATATVLDNPAVYESSRKTTQARLILRFFLREHKGQPQWQARLGSNRKLGHVLFILDEKSPLIPAVDGQDYSCFPQWTWVARNVAAVKINGVAQTEEPKYWHEPAKRLSEPDEREDLSRYSKSAAQQASRFGAILDPAVQVQEKTTVPLQEPSVVIEEPHSMPGKPVIETIPTELSVVVRPTPAQTVMSASLSSALQTPRKLTNEERRAAKKNRRAQKSEMEADLQAVK